MLEHCELCGHRCGVNRLAGELGKCRCGVLARIASSIPHRGEEPMLGPLSGTIFLSGCNLRCVYCQNWQISREGRGKDATSAEFADMMLALQSEGTANISFVTPTPWTPQILDALVLAVEDGLHLPIVWNTGGYDTLENLHLLDGIIDIYLPDMRYSWGTASERYSGATDYPQVNRAAVIEMYRQVGDIIFNERNQALRGLLIRLLVLPNELAGVRETLEWMSKHLSKLTWFSLMAQYAPLYHAADFPEIDRVIKEREYKDLLNLVDKMGFENFYAQSPDSREVLRPNFDSEAPFS